MVNLMQRLDSATGDYNNDCTGKRTSGESKAMDEASYLFQQNIREQITELESESDSGSSEDSDEGDQAVGTTEEESEFGNTELENLVLSEGPQQIMQLMLQDKAADFMKEEVTDDDDYADWIQWAADAEQCKQKPSKARNAGQRSVLLQIQQMEVVDPYDCVKERIMKNPKEDTWWGEICQKIRIDQHLDKGMERTAVDSPRTISRSYGVAWEQEAVEGTY
ncbi:unnamed protein product [Sphagnum balticum]